MNETNNADTKTGEKEAEVELLTFTAEIDEDGMRLDRFITSRLDNVTRSRIKDLIKSGHVAWTGNQQSTNLASHQQRTIIEPNRRVKYGDEYTLTLPPPVSPIPKPENIALNIVYEDQDLIVIDKPANMVVHPATGNWSGTLVNGLLYHCGESLSGIGGVKRPGIVHRLDKDTSGLLVVAKNDHAHQSLSAQFADHGRTGPLRRCYTAFIWGGLYPAKGVIDAAIGRHPHNPLKMALRSDTGKMAITHYQTLSRFSRSKRSEKTATNDIIASEISCELETGRTHQIRVHLASQGHPLIADPLYGQGFKTKALALPDNIQNQINNLNRQALHARLLGFAHPRTEKYLEFDSELPKKLAKLKKSLETL